MRLKASTARPTSSRGGVPGSPPGLEPSRPVARRKVREAFGELLDRPADPMRDEDERRQRDEPRRAEQQEQREREPAPEVAALDRFHELPRLPQLARELLHADAARGRGCTPARRAAPAPSSRAPQVVDVIAAGSGQAEPLGLAAVPERPDGVRPASPRPRPRTTSASRGRPARPASAHRARADRTAARWLRACATGDPARRWSRSPGCDRAGTW